jgi:hypothetical protein
LPYETDASLHIEGTGESAWGTKFVIVATQDLQANARIILDAAFVATSGGEAAKAVDMFVQLRPFVQPRPPAAAQKDGGKTRQRVEKTTYVESKTVVTPSGVREKLFARGGQIGLKAASRSRKRPRLKELPPGAESATGHTKPSR